MNKIIDQNYLKNGQYKNSDNLNARIFIHQRYSTNQYGWYRWEFEHLQVQPGERILDIGCGPAELWKSQIKRLPNKAELVLCDLSRGMAAAAKSATSGNSVLCCAADAQHIPFESESFDLVTANHMLYHVPDIQCAVAEIRRVLRPGGRLVAATNGLDHMKELTDLIRSMAPDYKPGGDSAKRFGLENGQAQLATYFPDTQVQIYEDALFVTDAEPMVDYIASMWWYAEWNEDLRKQVTDQVEAQIRSHGGFRIQKSSGVISAR